MIILGVPFSEQRLMEGEVMQGGSPYGATTITRGDGSRMPSEAELEIAKTQGRHVATVTGQLVKGRA
jgi:NAD(P)H dehydrogenase (quinone)